MWQEDAAVQLEPDTAACVYVLLEVTVYRRPQRELLSNAAA